MKSYYIEHNPYMDHHNRLLFGENSYQVLYYNTCSYELDYQHLSKYLVKLKVLKI